MSDYDMAACLKPVLGTADDQAMQGAVFTAWIDTLDHKGLAFLANISAAAQHDAVAWTLQDAEESDQSDSAAVAAAEVIVYPPSNGATRLGSAGSARNSPG